MWTLPINDGHKIPSLALGTWKLDPAQAPEAIIKAIDIGYRHIDCAHIYGNEKAIGNAFRKVEKNGSVKRSSLWVTSKLWNDCHRPQHVAGAIKRSLANLGLDYLDLYLIHWPIAHVHGIELPESSKGFLEQDKVPLAETWNALENCVQEGLCRYIGVSNFNVSRLESVVKTAKIKPLLNQVESHPLLQQKSLLKTCRDHDIYLAAYAPLGSGDRPETMVQDSDPILLRHGTICKIAKQRNCLPAQVAIAWGLSRKSIVVAKSSSAIHLNENWNAQMIELSEDELKEIDSIADEHRYIDGEFWKKRGYPGSIEGLWKN